VDNSDFLSAHATTFPEGIVSCPDKLVDVFVPFAVAVYHSGTEKGILFLYTCGDAVFGGDSVFHMVLLSWACCTTRMVGNSMVTLIVFPAFLSI